MMRQITSGAEAVIYKQDNIIKDRIKKKYRIPEIDMPLRKSRTRREAKILDKLAGLGFPAPRLISMDDKDMKIEMEFINNKKLRDVLDEKNCISLCSELGRKIAFLHNNNMIHGDLTTSNMIVSEEIYFIDFGLSFFSDKIEDKAVDLHLLRQALESKHYMLWEKAFKSAVDSYKKHVKEGVAIIKRLEIVELRGRNKTKF